MAIYAGSITIINTTPYAWTGEVIVTQNTANPQYSNSYGANIVAPGGGTITNPIITTFSDPTQLTNLNPNWGIFTPAPSAVFIGMKGAFYTISQSATVGTPGTFLGYLLTQIYISPSVPIQITWQVSGNDIYVKIT